jgi:Caudovirus prohead serine protease
MIGRGDVAGMSFGMHTRPEDSNVSQRDGVWHRMIRTIRRLTDVTLTWEPSYPATSLELRSATLALPLEQLEDADGLIRERRFGHVDGLKRSGMSQAELDAAWARAHARIDALEAGVTNVNELNLLAPW